MVRLPDDRFRIFVSHKHSDADLAGVVQDQLEGLSPMFECFVSGRNITSGSDWSRAITMALGRSHLLLLLFTVPARNWDWCLYEAGLFIQFAAAAEEDVRSVVSIFDPATGPPRPLAAVQGVPADAKAIGKVLKKLCHEPWEVSDGWRRGAVDENIDAEAIDAAAQAIADAFTTAIASQSETPGAVRYASHRLVLDAEIDAAGDVVLPDEAHIRTGPGATTAFTLSLFGLAIGEAPHFWGELLDRVDARSEPWVTDLNAALAAAYREELIVPGSATMRAWGTESDRAHLYRPMLYSVDRTSGSLGERAEIVVVLDPLPMDSVAPGPEPA